MGSDYVYPHAANRLIRQDLRRLRVPDEDITEHYLPLDPPEAGATLQVDAMFKEIADTIAAEATREVADEVTGEVTTGVSDLVVLNTINGAWGNRRFFEELKRARVDLGTTAVLSFALDEGQIEELPEGLATRSHVAWSYLESLPVPANREFVAAWRREHPETPVSEPMANAYTAVHLWAEAARLAKSFDVPDVLAKTHGLSISAPGDVEYLEAQDIAHTEDPNDESFHAWRSIRIAMITEEGELKVEWENPAPIAPDSWPGPATTGEWESFLAELKASWGGQWAAPPLTAEVP
ncbi:MAG: transporter substrate-binding protein [Proteobacteria bacterium]|nr:transporter substrate-binding protein [Pseudomonadota bacterium]